MNRVYHTLQKRFVLGKMRGKYMKTGHYTNRYYTNRYYTTFDGKEWVNKEVEKINQNKNGGNNDDDDITSAAALMLAALCIYNILPPSPPSSFA